MNDLELLKRLNSVWFPNNPPQVEVACSGCGAKQTTSHLAKLISCECLNN